MMTRQQKIDRLRVLAEYMELSIKNFGEIVPIEAAIETLQSISDGTLDTKNEELAKKGN